MKQRSRPYPLHRYVAAWLVHLLTASGAVFGLLALLAINQRQFVLALWFMGASIVVDSFDGTLARKVMVTRVTPNVDGALLDNMIDYLNFVIVPAFFVYVSDLLPAPLRVPVAAIIVLSSAYQFTQRDAKTADHFFKGFPDYWNIVVFYLFLWQTSPILNVVLLFVLAVLVFVPIKYVYPSRMEYLTHRRWLRQAMFAATVLWGVMSAILLAIFPQTNTLLVGLSMAYIVLYAGLSVYRTLVPLPDAPHAIDGSFQTT